VAKQTIGDGHVVRTADGTICRVVSLYRQPLGRVGEYGAQLAELRNLETDEPLELPVAELTRIADPRNRRPPVEGLPDEPRPRCQRCDRLFAWVTKDEYSGAKAGPLAPRITARRFVRWSSYRGLFCTLTCALSFAELAHAAGYRIQRRPASTSATEGTKPQ